MVALGADLDPGATPGLLAAGHVCYTVGGAFATADVIDSFDGGRVVIGVLSTPYKCPPAPSETALLMHEHLTLRGLRDRSRDRPGRRLPASDSALAAGLRGAGGGFAERGIEWHPRREVCELDPARKVAILRDGGELPYDLFLAVPVHRAPTVVLESPLAVDGWIPVNSLTLETSFPGVFAIGDVAAVGTPRAGVFAEGHAAVAAERISALIRGTTTSAEYGGRGVCYIEFGADQVAKVDVTFFGDQRSGELEGPADDPVPRSPSSAQAASNAGSAGSGRRPKPRSACHRRDASRARTGSWNALVHHGLKRSKAPRRPVTRTGLRPDQRPLVPSTRAFRRATPRRSGAASNSQSPRVRWSEGHDQGPDDAG